MSIQEVQGPLMNRPTGMAVVIAEHEYNPLNGFYEPLLHAAPDSATVLAIVAGATLTTVPATVNARYAYILVLSNTGAVGGTVTITDQAGAIMTMFVPANGTIAIVSTPSAPIFQMAVGAVNVTSTIAAIQVFVSYFDK